MRPIAARARARSAGKRRGIRCCGGRIPIAAAIAASREVSAKPTPEPRRPPAASSTRRLPAGTAGAAAVGVDQWPLTRRSRRHALPYPHYWQVAAGLELLCGDAVIAVKSTLLLSVSWQPLNARTAAFTFPVALYGAGAVSEQFAVVP